ncbi:hypothetical protein ACFVTT_35455 [Streptomyces niveus]
MNVFAWIGASLVLHFVGAALVFRVMPATVTLLRRHGGRHAR